MSTDVRAAGLFDLSGQSVVVTGAASGIEYTTGTIIPVDGGMTAH